LCPQLNGISIETAILSVDYALSPENKYPTALQQILDVYLWLASDACVPALGYRPRRVVVCGDSAGGNLSLALCLVVHDICREGEPLLRPKGVVCFYTP
jgi:acetyl esterase